MSHNGITVEDATQIMNLETAPGGVALLEVVEEASCATAWPLWDKQCRMSFESWLDA